MMKMLKIKFNFSGCLSAIAYGLAIYLLWGAEGETFVGVVALIAGITLAHDSNRSD